MHLSNVWQIYIESMKFFKTKAPVGFSTRIWAAMAENLWKDLLLIRQKRPACRFRQGFLYSFYKSLDIDSLFLYCSMLSEQSGVITWSEARLCFPCWFVSLGQLFSPSHCQEEIITTVSAPLMPQGSIFQNEFLTTDYRRKKKHIRNCF